MELDNAIKGLKIMSYLIYKSDFKYNRLRWSKFGRQSVLNSHSAGVLKSLKFNPGKNCPGNFNYFFV